MGHIAKYNDIELGDKPMLIIVPVSLYHQMLGEIHRFLQWKLFDLYGYTGKYESRREFWTEGWTRGVHLPHRKILLATNKVSAAWYNACVDEITEGHEGHRIRRHYPVLATLQCMAGGHQDSPGARGIQGGRPDGLRT